MGIAAGTREVLQALEPRPEAARLARRALAAAGLHEDVAHAVNLLTTEVIANALRHSGVTREQRLVLAARVGEDFARVEIGDPGPGFDPEEVEKGLGLRLLHALAARWGMERRERGCRVWFEVDRRPAGRFAR
jgi:anti-sigma regulatory factor (Ser/Thr protein kinase)